MTQDSKENGSASGPLDRLKSEATGLLDALGDKAVTSLRDSVEGATERLTDFSKGAATPGLKAAAAGAKSLAAGKNPVSSLVSAGTTAVKDKIGGAGNSDGGGKNTKVTNIIESIDVGVPIKLAYDQWTRFTDFPSFAKKVENVEQQEDETVTWKAQILWSHRTWESTILEQVPEDKIVWRSKGAKGYVDGAVTFHALAPNLTRIIVVLEYHPQGFFERTGNLWRAQGRRTRLELKNFQRYVMTEAVLHSDEIDGWRGTISDGKVRRTTTTKRGAKNQAAKQGRSADSSGRGSRTTRATSGRRASASTGTGTRSKSKSQSQGSKSQSDKSQGSSRPGNGRRSTGTGASTRSSASARGGSRSSAASRKSSARTTKAS